MTNDVDESSDHLPTAWLFTRGESSVHIEVSERRRRFQLVVRGPATAAASYHFETREALLVFMRGEHQRLVEGGFQLQAVAERRSGVDRRPASLPLQDRRRP